jgi:hypothetical protein
MGKRDLLLTHTIDLQVSQYHVPAPREINLVLLRKLPSVMKNVYKCHSELFMNGDHSADLGVDTSIILKIIIKNRIMG